MKDSSVLDKVALVYGQMNEPPGNRLRNAQGFNPVGQPIELSAQHQGGRILISVRDHGPGAKWITDLDVSYTFVDSLTVSIGGTNIFDVRPDKHAVYSNLGLAAYGNPPFYPGGGYWYTKLAYDF